MKIGSPASAQAVAIVLLFGVLLLPASARAQSGEIAAYRLTEASMLYEDVRYKKALAAYRLALKAPDLSPGQRFEALLGQGFCLLILGKNAQARSTLDQALRMNPGYETPSSLSPKLRSAIASARDGLDLSPIAIDLNPGDGGSAPELLITASDPGDRIAKIVTLLRADSGASFAEVQMTLTAPGQWAISLPEKAGREREVEVVVTARNAHGFTIAHLGTRSAPESILLPDAPASPPEASGSPTSALPTEGSSPIASLPGKPPDASPGGPPDWTDEPLGPEREGNLLSPLAWTAGGLAVATLGTGLLFSLDARAAARRYNGDPTRYASQDQALEDAARATRNASRSIGFYAGGGLMAVTGGLLLYFSRLSRERSPGDADAPGFAIVPAPGGATMLVAGRF